MRYDHDLYTLDENVMREAKASQFHIDAIGIVKRYCNRLRPTDAHAVYTAVMNSMANNELSTMEILIALGKTLDEHAALVRVEA